MKLTAPKQRQGDYYETLACQYLQAQGLTLIAKNWHYKNMGEIDLVMLDNTSKILTLVFIEVRQRKISEFGNSFGTAKDSISTSKQRKIIKTAQAFLTFFHDFSNLQINNFDNCDVRFDTVTFTTSAPTSQNPPQLDWIKEAFWAE